MFPFPGLHCRSESVLPFHMQDPSDIAAHGIQLRFRGRPRWEIVEVAHLTRQPMGRTAKLADEGAEGGQLSLNPDPTEAAPLSAREALQARHAGVDSRP